MILREINRFIIRAFFYLSAIYLTSSVFAIPCSGKVMIDTCKLKLVLPDTFIHRIFTIHLANLSAEHESQFNEMDDEFMDSFNAVLSQMQKSGFNEIVIPDLFISQSWSPEIEHTLDQKKKNAVLKIIASIHKAGKKVLAVSNLYSKEYDKILKANPALACSHNSSIVCPNHVSVWSWQQKILDYIFSFPVDGILLQSATQGRCMDCNELNALSEMQYFASVNDKVASYLRHQYPGKIIGILSTGLNLVKSSDLVSIQQLSRNADLLIDDSYLVYLNSVADTICKIANAIAPCFYGHLSLPLVDPGSVVESENWFVPMIRRKSLRMQKMFNSGARVIENRAYHLKNPGEEVSLLLAGVLQNDPAENLDNALKKVLTDVYQPKDPSTLKYLADLFVKAEEIFYESLGPSPELIKLGFPLRDSSGSPAYLKNMQKMGSLNDYKKNLCVLKQIFSSLINKVDHKDKLEQVVKCINNTIEDIKYLTKEPGCAEIYVKDEMKKPNQKLKTSLSYIPKQGEIRVFITNPVKSHSATLKLWNVCGKLLKNQDVFLKEGKNDFMIAYEGLAEGFYYIELIDSVFEKREQMKLFAQ